MAPLPSDPAYRPAPLLPEEPRRVELPPEGPASGKRWTSDACCPADEARCGPCLPSCGDPGGAGLLDPLGRLLGIEARGWIDQGVTVNTYSPRDRSNGPVVYNDRSNDYQMNQLYLIMESPIDADRDRLQIGGRVDLLYGTDHVYTSSLGLESFRDGGAKWNSDNGPVGTNYGLSMPQLYLEAFAPWGNGLSVKLGHFYTIMGYEVVEAPENFFYSHAYHFQYAEPLTHTGLLAEYALGERLKLQAGLTRGWDTWEDNNNDLGFLGGLAWTSRCRRTSLALSMHTGPEADEPPAQARVRTAYSLVLRHKLSERLTYGLHHDWGYEPRATAADPLGNWYGLNQYLIYRMNPIWAAGLRFEWFYDKGGTRVLDTPTPQPAHFFELTAGLNWTPRERLIVRPEIRWDWASDSAVHPFVDATRDHQLLVAMDVIVTF